ncbi:hypothetical protein GCM10011608_60010 [Micromonospora sonchi]|uniref:Uncharacterized protein n=1 Tax=Micromonospora sonchi TaxID=1763543 RepID=A0A917UBQ6_9ACTN|nr:hypothetical protein [Micromonospora sonchi]GGM66686.1 hypothetical protein GCM10011608_60010 [Micromonospora sonchi]
MTVHLISVGRSLLDAFAKRRDLFGGLHPTISRYKPQELLSEVGTSTAAMSDRLAIWFGSGGRLPTKEADLIRAVEADRWPVRVCAEMETFHRVTGRRSVTDDEMVVLLATDTIAGLRSGLWTAVGLAGGATEKIRYVDDPEWFKPAPGVTLVRVPYLDASSESGFAKAMAGLGTMGRALLPSEAGPSESFHFHLSGGFKAAIPYLIGLAEGLRSFPPSQVSAVQAYVLHDTSEQVIRLPLRRLNRCAVQKELAGFAPDGSLRGLPNPRSMDGYAYDADDSTRRAQLTPFGVGLRTLMGIPAEPIGRG